MQSTVESQDSLQVLLADVFLKKMKRSG